MTYSWFIENLGFFGSFPSQQDVDSLSDKVHLIINLTEPHEEGLGDYAAPPNCRVWHYPIIDESTPDDWSKYALFVLAAANYIKEGKGILVHCRGGHGRSSLVAASILLHLDPQLHVQDAIRQITLLHHQRKGLSKKWTRPRIPLSRVQRTFLFKFFSTIYFSKAYQAGTQAGFSTLSAHELTVDEISFPTTETLFQYLKDPDNDAYVDRLLSMKKALYAKLIGEENEIQNGITVDISSLMERAYRIKYEQHPELRDPLLRTRLKRLHDSCRYSHPDNLVGRILSKLRDEWLLTEAFNQDFSLEASLSAKGESPAPRIHAPPPCEVPLVEE